MTVAAGASFTFSVLDELAFAAVRQRLPNLADGAYFFEALGPILELARLSVTGLLPAPTRAAWLALGDAKTFSDAVRTGSRRWSSPERDLGFLRLQISPPADETEENGFKLEAQRAAVAAGFPPKFAAH